MFCSHENASRISNGFSLYNCKNCERIIIKNEMEKFLCNNCQKHIGFTENERFYFQTPSGEFCLVDLKEIPFHCPNDECKKRIRFVRAKRIDQSRKHTVN